MAKGLLKVAAAQLILSVRCLKTQVLVVDFRKGGHLISLKGNVLNSSTVGAEEMPIISNLKRTVRRDVVGF